MKTTPDGSSRVSRRRLLAVSALGTVAALGASPALRRAVWGADDRREPFFGRHQGGIVTRPQQHLLFAAFDFTGFRRDALRRLMKTWTAAALREMSGGPRLTSADPFRPPLDTGEAFELGHDNLTLTFGFGPSLFRKVGLTASRPEALIDLPLFDGDQLDANRCHGDLCIQACADSQVRAYRALHTLAIKGGEHAELRWVQSGFRSDNSRNLLGFQDGTNNLDVRDEGALERYVWSSPRDSCEWMVHGTYAVVRRIEIDLEAWDHTYLKEQERVIGRRRADGTLLNDRRARSDLQDLPMDSHVRVANPGTDRTRDERLLRRSYNFTDGFDNSLGYLSAGLFFVAFQRDPRQQFVPIQRRLAAQDRLREFTLHRGSAIFAVLPGVSIGGYLGETILS